MLRTPTRLLTVFCLALGLVTAPVQASAAAGDTDGDGLLDVWETQGYDANGDGVIDVDLPAMGANPLRKDLFVEMDYMPGLLPEESTLDKIVEIFATMPVQNPDGSRGVSIHLDAGSARGPKYDLGGGNEVPHRHLPRGVEDVSEARGTESASARSRIFHYMMWADSYGDDSSSGQAWMPGLEFLVTVGPKHWPQNVPTYQIGTFVHELGHNLGLRHGGTDDVNDKPNYLSVMNYLYQLGGVPRMDGTSYYGFSQRVMPSLDENALVESAGLGSRATGWRVAYRKPNDFWVIRDARGPLDYNDDGAIATTPFAQDINGDETHGLLTGPSDVQTIRFPAGVSAGVTYGRRSAPVTNELTADEAARRQSMTR